jgi:hypothetical protein
MQERQPCAGWSRGRAFLPPRKRAGKHSAPGAGRERSSGLLGLVILLLVSAVSVAHAEDRVRLQGLADAEFWNTSDEPDSLARDEGQPAPLGRLRLWGVGTLVPRLQGFALVRMQGGDASPVDYSGVVLEQAYLRWVPPGDHRLLVQAGRIYLPYGNFARRYLSSVNPLIGSPVIYQLSYPMGLQINGAAGRWDYMVAVLDQPLTRQDYGSGYRSTPRPALASGITPIAGLRLGAYFTRGPYLSRIADAWLLPGRNLEDYRESVLGGDLQYSVEHFELNGEIARTSLQVPGAATAGGRVWYLEPKYTFTPRWYGAMRWERGEQAEAVWRFGTSWSAGVERVRGLEAGLGFRVGPDLLLKASYRAERIEEVDGSVARGDAVALQISYRFDVNSWVERPR